MKQKKAKPLKTKLLRKLRNKARCKLGVFKFSDGKYRVVFDRTLYEDVSRFDEKEWRRWGDEYGCEVFNKKDDVSDNLEDAKKVCDHYRRQYILNKVREKRLGNATRMY